MDLPTLLRESPAFATLSDIDLRSLAAAMVVSRHEGGHVFLRPGERGGDVFFVLEGQVEVVTRGSAFPVRTLAPGSLFGLLALVDQEPRSTTCTAAGPCTVAVLPHPATPLLFNQSAPLACAFQKAVALQLATDFRNLSTLLQHLAHEE